MIKKIQFQVDYSIAYNPVLLNDEIWNHLSVSEQDKLFYKILKRSIDARSGRIKINLTLQVGVNEIIPVENFGFNYQDAFSSNKTCHIVGAGPAGLFAALRCLELGIKPIIIERGKDVQSRRRDLAAINKEHKVNPESNYCFGEGGAGTYSDGKLYTRSSKRGDIEKILKALVFHGADENILVDAHPHIGTNKLPQLIQKIRETILKHGGEISFNTKLVDVNVKGDKIETINLQHENSISEIKIQNLILATGHSARDIYELLDRKKILIETKPFALGVRIEHPQEIIDRIQYHCRNDFDLSEKRKLLPAASYSLVHQSQGRGVYSFCMCPGGIIAPCATLQNEIVTNGWSPSKRNNPYANSGIVVALNENDFSGYKNFGALKGLEFQKAFEKKAWEFGGMTQTAPAQRLTDFVNHKTSSSLPKCSYQPGIISSDIHQLLGEKISSALRDGFKNFGAKMKGYLTNEAVLVAVESRTSTPVRIPRDAEKLHHPQIKNLFPCGEGAGYAGGIMSAAMDGERCANIL